MPAHGKICLVTNCITQVYHYGNVCSKHRWRMKKFNSYDLPNYKGEPNYLDLPVLPEGFVKNCKRHGFIKIEDCYVYGDRGTKRYNCRACELARRKIENFNLTEQQYEEMLIKQNYTCEICKEPESTKRNGQLKKLAVDHCHKTGKIRNLLCQFCNSGIGYFKDSIELLQKAIDYLKKHNE
jgi:Recombination endonuclease VII